VLATPSTVATNTKADLKDPMDSHFLSRSPYHQSA